MKGLEGSKQQSFKVDFLKIKPHNLKKGNSSGSLRKNFHESPWKILTNELSMKKKVKSCENSSRSSHSGIAKYH